MKVYLVGGAVRDNLLGRFVKDRDYVVVGSSAEEMLALGFSKVGADFPVFLNPLTKDEYALARTERKSGTGYHGFVVNADPSVTLEEDLRRRDLTINSMAREHGTNNLIDPFGGVQDLENRILRHTSEAFAEDPLRVLRVARFAARYGFTVATETLELMNSLVEAGEMTNLTIERVWTETEKALMETSPVQYIEVLRACNAWESLFPEINTDPAIPVFNTAVEQNFSFDERIAALLSSTYLTKADNLLVRYKAPAETIRLVHNLWKIQIAFDAYQFQDDKRSIVFELLKATDAHRRPESLLSALRIFSCYSNEKHKTFETNLHSALNKTNEVTFASLPVRIQNQGGAAVGEAINTARLEILRELTFTS